MSVRVFALFFSDVYIPQISDDERHGANTVCPNKKETRFITRISSLPRTI